MFKNNPQSLPALSVLIAAAIWGLFWIPMRDLDARGIELAWPALVLNVASLVVLLPIALYRWRRFLHQPWLLAFSGIFIGAAMATYGVSVNLTEVVRAILLFYLSPIWSTIIGVIWLGERITVKRLIALVFGFVGMAVVIGVEDGLPLPQNTGDWLALAAGVCWSLGSTGIYVAKKIKTFEIGYAFALGAVVCLGFMFLVFPINAMGPIPSNDALWGAAGYILLMVFILMVPVLFLTTWGAKHLPPATVGILLLADLVVAVATAAMFAGEPFGWREIIGTVLIASAAVLEVLPSRKAKPIVDAL